VLIASTVVEVGVDVPEASVMLVEAAHRFGLAQLHQLRGRVGRGSKASRCFLMAPAEDPKGMERLQVLEKSSDGLAIAQADLDIRWVLQDCSGSETGLAGLGVWWVCWHLSGGRCW
jgi:ATP-dependent DNA helicase RecG